MSTNETKWDHKQWQSLEDFIDDEDFEQVMRAKFPRETKILHESGMNRRDFIKLMGASLVVGGLSLSGCAPDRSEQEEILPYVRMPEEIVPGQPIYFASTMPLSGYGTGVVIETHEGRPHRVEGNSNHPASLGGANMAVLASVLELYNPNRVNEVRRDGQSSSFAEFLQEFDEAVANLGDGSGLRILSEKSSSPTLAKQINALLEMYPNARWYQYDTVGRENVYAGAQLAFGEIVEPVYQIDQADVIVSLDSDFLMTMPGNVRYAHDFAAKRRIRVENEATMNRLYAVNSTPNNTSTVADHHIAMKASEIENFALALANAVGAEGGEAVEGDWDQAIFDAMVSDLQAHSSVVIVGDEQPPAVHALAHAINAVLGSAGETVTYIPPVLTNTHDSVTQLSDFVGDISSGRVDAAFIIGGNPAFTAPDIPLSAAVGRVPFSVRIGMYDDETAENARWYLPYSTYIEAWGDVRAHDGTASIIQPPIGALYDGSMSELELIARLMQDDRSGYEILLDSWREDYSGDESFDAFWRRSLHNGVIADSAPDPVQPSLSGSFASDVADALIGASNDFEVIFRLDPRIYDGRFSYNSWLHEIPHPLTKITWDNFAMISANTADALRLDNEQIISITVGNNIMEIPVYVVHGHPDDCVSVGLGYGHGISADLDAGENFNAYALRPTTVGWFTVASVERTRRTYKLARTQKNMELVGTKAVRSGTLEEFIENHEFAVTGSYKEKDGGSFLDETIWQQEVLEEGNQWGMSIDLTTCIGCNACMVACQSENNIPTVGKEQVLQERDMHWIRVDSFVDEHDEDRRNFQPVPCMHCENAPCEQVCPVQATVHDHEGLNQMIYNRCVGTRYCSANCPYGVRRFNFHDYTDDTLILQEQRNPDVSVRVRGVMEKCTYCWQRINQGRVNASVEDRPIRDGEVRPACGTACPTQAITFGNLNDPNARVVRDKAQPTNYLWLDAELNTRPRTTYLAKLYNPNAALAPVETSEDDDSTQSEEE
jgi:MoCo/4Fe-4S cofactor protein with predicted Tat translocation signal